MSNIRMTRVIAGVRVRVESHRQPHLDEIAGLWLIERFADEAWVRAHCPKNRLQLGIGLGEFDEHSSGTGQRKCCLELVAASLGLEQDPRLAQLLKFAHACDVEGKGQPFDLHNLVKLINLQHPNDPRFVIRWVFTALGAKFAEQEDFRCSIEAVKAGKRITIGLEGGLRLLVVESDCRTIMKAAMAWYRDMPPDVIVQRLPDGHVMIFTNKKSRISLAQVIAELRKAEAQIRGNEFPSEADLSAEGFLPPDQTWYYFRPPDSEMILNGSNTARVEPTRLSLDQVIERVVAGLK